MDLMLAIGQAELEDKVVLGHRGMSGGTGKGFTGSPFRIGREAHKE